MAWPVSQDYNEAVQDPRGSFADPELRASEAATNALGLPIPRSGNFADVYELRHPQGGRWAVKCFTREVANLHERYAEISAHLQRVALPFSVEFTYLEEGIRVRGHWYPVLKMQWVEGLLVNEFVRDHLDRPAQLVKLAELWHRMARRLREAGVAHGDLQHGNVVLVPGSKAASLALKLIDYDGMYVPALKGRASGEVGHPAYQHPQRLREGAYGPEVDRFPLLLVATALRALVAGGATLWEAHDNGDNLLFRQADLKDPAGSALFRRLWQLPDPQLHALVGYLATACVESIHDSPQLDELSVQELPSEVRARARELLGPEPTLAPQVARSAGVEEFESDVEIVPPPFPAKETSPTPSREWTPAVGVAWALALAGLAMLVLLIPFVYWVATWRTEPPEPPEPPQQVEGPTPPPGGDVVPDPPVLTKLPPSNPARPGVPRPLPPEQDVDAAREELRKQHEASLAKGEPAARVALAHTLLRESNAPEVEAPMRVAMLQEAKTLAASLGDFPLAVRSLSRMRQWFLVPPWEPEAEAAESCAPLVLSRTQNLLNLREMFMLAEVARRVDAHTYAVRILTAALPIAGRLGDEYLPPLVASRLSQARKLARAHATVATIPAAETKQTPEMRLELSLFQTLHKGDWKQGLRGLARGSDPEFADLARRDLAADRASPAGQLAVADAWWDLADMETGLPEINLRQRARHWYQTALPGLSGEDLERAEMRLTVVIGEEELRPGLVGEYFQGTTLAAKMKGRIDRTLSFSWGTGATDPALPEGSYSCRWQGYLVPPTSGTYRLLIRGKGEMRLFHEDKPLPLIPVGVGHAMATVRITTPCHHLVVEHVQSGPPSPLALLWEREGVFPMIEVPPEALYHNLAQERRLAVR